MSAAESTEVIYGTETFVKRLLEAYVTYNKTVDACFDHTGPCLVVTTEPIFKALNGLVSRGLRLRYLTDIIPDNISYCKEMMKNGHQLRHLDGVKGNFGINDGEEYVTHTVQRESELLSHVTVTNIRSFVESQQYSFDVLWNKVMSAEERITEIEERTKPDFIETISDPNKIQKLGFDLVKSAKEEVLTIFSTANAFCRQERSGLIQLLQEVTASKDSLKIRILTPIDEQIQWNTLQERLKENQKLIFDI